jgi:Sulfotransferase domain
MSLELVCAGFGRTGTVSLKEALEVLGFEPCWHIEDMRGRMDDWRRLAAGEPMDWAALLEGYRAASDFPVCLYYCELLATFPDAKVVLTVSDPESWVSSVQALYNDAFLRFAGKRSDQPGPGRVWAETIDKLVWQRLGDMSDAEGLRRVYEEHIEAVCAHVPAQRLLVFNVREGWTPLCNFLGVSVPATHFPRLNKRAGLRSIAGRAAGE